jgi:hypothetical protein
MKLKSILLTVVATISLATATMAQVPNYVPSNDLVGWWPFNGNANDESGNGNNGTVNGATLTTDRNGQANKAYSFNGIANHITVSNQVTSLISNSYSVSFWILTSDTSLQSDGHEVIADRDITTFDFKFRMNYGIQQQPFQQNTYLQTCSNSNSTCFGVNTLLPSISVWEHYVMTYNNSNIFKAYKNGVLLDSVVNVSFSAGNRQINIGRSVNPNNPNGNAYYNGLVDDIGIWNRALTQQEITALYNASNCANNTSITPQTNSLTVGSTAPFTVTTSDPNPSFVWQSNLGQGFQTLNDVENYSGTNTANLNITNVQISEHNQPIRVISTSGNCIDTSNVAVINILDTCITNVTVFDTVLTTVTDTLVINTQITGSNPPNNLNTLKVFPNPASTHITIDYGNFNAMSGYTLTIVNSIGQTVFTTPINQQTSYIDLSTWTGNGIYFVQLIDPQNNTIENRKIVIQ